MKHLCKPCYATEKGKLNTLSTRFLFLKLSAIAEVHTQSSVIAFRVKPEGEWCGGLCPVGNNCLLTHLQMQISCFPPITES